MTLRSTSAPNSPTSPTCPQSKIPANPQCSQTQCRQYWTPITPTHGSVNTSLLSFTLSNGSLSNYLSSLKYSSHLQSLAQAGTPIPIWCDLLITHQPLPPSLPILLHYHPHTSTIKAKELRGLCILTPSITSLELQVPAWLTNSPATHFGIPSQKNLPIRTSLWTSLTLSP